MKVSFGQRMAVFGCAFFGACAFFLIFGSAALAVWNINNGGGTTTATVSGNYGSGGGNLADKDALTADQIKDLLTNKISYGYNLKGYSQQIYDSAQKFNINPLFSLAIANKDSSLGTEGAGKTCRNPGNMQHRSDNFSKSGVTGIGNCREAYSGNPRWQAFKTYGDGMQAKIWLLRAHYMDKGLTTLPEIINKYCPPSECNVDKYVRDVESFMNKYGKMYK